MQSGTAGTDGSAVFGEKRVMLCGKRRKRTGMC